MIVLADLRWPEGTGIGIVKQELLQRAPDTVEIVDLGVAVGIGSPLSPFALARAIRKKKPKAGKCVFWSPGFMPPAESGGVPTVITVHDLTHLHFYSALHSVYYNLILRPLYRATSEIVCVSAYTREEFLGWSGVNAERVCTIYNAVPSSFYGSGASRAPLPFEYVLYPGNHRDNKNIERLIAAFAKSSLPGKGLRLLLTGSYNIKLVAVASRHNVKDFIVFAGFVPEGDIAALYRGAKLIAYVSLYEGFGLPILEAMAAEVPILTSNVSSMPEIAAEAALLVDPYSEDSISNGLDELAYNDTLRGKLVRRGRERVKKFSWDRSSAEHWAVVLRAAGR